MGSNAKMKLFFFLAITFYIWVSTRFRKNVQETPRHPVSLVINSYVCSYVKPKIVVMVTSHARNSRARSILRRAYPKDLFAKMGVCMMFALGVSAVGVEASTTLAEQRKYGDLIQGDFVEAYRNLTYKHLMGLKWTVEYCRSAEFVIKMDDDIGVNFYTLFNLMKEIDFDILGCVIAGMKPIRDLNNKWFVTKEEYAASHYPDFVSGWVYIAKIPILKRMLAASDEIPYFWIDDVYVTGILSSNVGARLVDIRPYFRYDPTFLSCCIGGKIGCDFVAAPTGGKYELSGDFSKRLWACHYRKKCSAKNVIELSKGEDCYEEWVQEKYNVSHLNQFNAIN